MNSNKEGNFEKVKVILLDVAGTTTSLKFVKEKLFPFIKDEAATYLKKNFENESVKKALEGIKENDKELDVETAVEQIIKLTNENSENASLKTLQGLISKEGYESGSLKAHIYEDVRAAFENWSVNKKIAIYSTGDKESQKLLFEHTDQGNLSSHISNYFDQSIGIKTEPESYTKILEELKVSAEEVLFVNDNSKELCAAKKSGLLTALIKREGNADVDEKSKEISITISSFSELSFEASNKRKIEETSDGTQIPPSKVPKTVETKPTKLETKIDETEKSSEITNSADAKETPCEIEAMEVDSSSEKATVTEKSAEAESKDSMETEEVKSEEVPKTESEKTEVDETPAKVEETKNKVDNEVEEKLIETETKTENSAEVGSSSNDKEEVATEDVAKEKERIEVTAKDDKETETKEVETESKVDASAETTEIDNAEVTTTNTIDEQQSKNETPADVVITESNHVQSDNKEELNKVPEEASSDKKEEVAESKTSDAVEEKPVINEGKVEETSTVDTNKNSTEDKNGISENGNKNEETTKSNEDVSNGVANGQENGDKSTDTKENEDETEIKVKKIETNEGSPAVAVEV